MSLQPLPEASGTRGAHPVPAAVGNHSGVVLRLISLGCTFAALVSRSFPALSPSVAVPGLLSWMMLHLLQACSCQHSVFFLTLHMLIPGSPLSLTQLHLPGKGLALAYLGWSPAASCQTLLDQERCFWHWALFSSILVVLPV